LLYLSVLDIKAMHGIEIKSSGDERFEKFRRLYASSFPIFEQRTESQQEYVFGCSQYHLCEYWDGGTFVGFISYWEFERQIYIEHLAVDTTLRGKGYGSRVRNSHICTQKAINNPFRVQNRAFRTLASDLHLNPSEVFTFDAVAVDKEYRGRGFQRTFIGWSIGLAESTGAKHIVATVDPQNIPGERNFLAQGFHVAETKTKHTVLTRDILRLDF